MFPNFFGEFSFATDLKRSKTVTVLLWGHFLLLPQSQIGTNTETEEMYWMLCIFVSKSAFATLFFFFDDQK